MRIVFITQDDPLYAAVFFKEFMNAEWPVDLHVCAIIVLDPMNKRSVSQLAVQMLKFYGLPGFIRQGIRYLVQIVGEKAGIGTGIRSLARRRGVVVTRVRNVNRPESLEMLKEMELDLIVSVAASQIFKPALLSIPRYGCINVHSGRLPKYRGMLPTFWQMLNGEPHATVTVHEMVASIDDGNVIFEKDVDIRPDDSLEDLIIRAKRLSALAVLDVVSHWETASANSRPVVQDGRSYYSFPRPEDVRQFRRMGRRLL